MFNTHIKFNLLQIKQWHCIFPEIQYMVMLWKERVKESMNDTQKPTTQDIC